MTGYGYSPGLQAEDRERTFVFAHEAVVRVDGTPVVFGPQVTSDPRKRHLAETAFGKQLHVAHLDELFKLLE